MQNDYEFDYYEYEYTSDFNESYDISDLDEDYARDGQDYESLAYRHYA